MLNIVHPGAAPGNNMNNSEVTVETSSKLALACLSNGRPVPVVTWYKDDEVLTADDLRNSTTMEMVDDGQTLSIKVRQFVSSDTLMSCLITVH